MATTSTFDPKEATAKMGKWSASDSKKLEDAAYDAHPDKERATFGKGKLPVDGGTGEFLNKSGRRVMRGYVETQFKHRSPSSGGYTAAREKLHDKIVGSLLSGHKPQSVPKIVFTAGGAASGKNHTVGKAAPPDSMTIDTDHIAEQLPEYHALLATGNAPSASHAVHREVEHIAKRAVNEGMARGLNIVAHGTGEGESFAGVVKAAKDHGYDTTVAYMHAPIQTAVSRDDRRAPEKGRHVYMQKLAQSHIGSSQQFEKVARLHGVHIKVYGPSGHLIAQGDGHKSKGVSNLKVHAVKTFNDFRAKANAKLSSGGGDA